MQGCAPRGGRLCDIGARPQDATCPSDPALLRPLPNNSQPPFFFFFFQSLSVTATFARRGEYYMDAAGVRSSETLRTAAAAVERDERQPPEPTGTPESPTRTPRHGRMDAAHAAHAAPNTQAPTARQGPVTPADTSASCCASCSDSRCAPALCGLAR